MKLLKLFLIFCGILLSSTSLKNVESYSKLVFFDDFRGGKLNDKNWNIETGSKNGATNCKEAILIKNHQLVIHPFTKNGKYFTGIINTRKKFEFCRGLVEIKAKFNPVAGTWADGWIYADSVGKNEKNYKKNGLEVDLFENRLFDWNRKNISNLVNQGFHWNGYQKFHECAGIDTEKFNLHLNDQKFHVFQLLWEPGGFIFLIDGQFIWKSKLDTNSKEFLILSVEAGELENWTQKPPKNLNQDVLTVDYVKVWQNE